LDSKYFGLNDTSNSSCIHQISPETDADGYLELRADYADDKMNCLFLNAKNLFDLNSSEVESIQNLDTTFNRLLIIFIVFRQKCSHDEFHVELQGSVITSSESKVGRLISL